LDNLKKYINFVVSKKGRYRSGQTGQTVNLLGYPFGGSNPSLPTGFAGVAQLVEHQPSKLRVAGSSPVSRSMSWVCGSSSVGRASASQAEGRGFESRFPLYCADVAQLVERFLGKEEVTGSIPVISSGKGV
jgi:hypothetical protein